MKRSEAVEIGAIGRLTFRTISSPLITLSIIGSGVALIGLLPKSSEHLLFGGLLFPWLLIALGLLLLPFLGAAVRGFRLPDPTRQHHALEHGTIHFLYKRYGKEARLSGRSDERGFRIAGSSGKQDILYAFEELRIELAKGNHQPTVAKRCGSMIAVTQAIGIFLLLLCAILFGTANLSPVSVLLVLCIVLGVVVAIRYPIGLWVQKHRLLSVAFTDATIESVSRQSHAMIFEGHPVFFVRVKLCHYKHARDISASRRVERAGKTRYSPH